MQIWISEETIQDITLSYAIRKLEITASIFDLKKINNLFPTEYAAGMPNTKYVDLTTKRENLTEFSFNLIYVYSFNSCLQNYIKLSLDTFDAGQILLISR